MSVREYFHCVANYSLRWNKAKSVPSERLFSGATLVYNDQRKRLLPEKAEMLLYLKYNLPSFGL